MRHLAAGRHDRLVRSPRGERVTPEDAELETPTELERSDTPGPASWLFCRRCQARICRQADRLVAFGAHTHERLNPAGFLFSVRLFKEAPGAMPVGPDSDEFAWFPHLSWQIAVCRACQSHLGWLFKGADRAFFGLRADMLEAGPPPPKPAAS